MWLDPPPETSLGCRAGLVGDEPEQAAAKRSVNIRKNQLNNLMIELLTFHSRIYS